MSTTDTAPTEPMSPDDVPADLVELARAAVREAAYAGGTFEPTRVALAAVLPVHGSQVLHRAGLDHYTRMENLARSLTTRAYGAALLFSLAADADAAASAGLEPELNTQLATMLRTRAHREGKP